MSLMRMWSICDRCGFQYRRGNLRKEATNFVVCASCYDGVYDARRHPQNRPAPYKQNPRRVPDGRQLEDLTEYLTDEQGNFVLTEDGQRTILERPMWQISNSIYVG